MHPLRRRTAVLVAITLVIAGACETGERLPSVVALPADTPAITPSPSPTASPTPSPSPSPTPTPKPDVPYDPEKFGFRAKGMTGEMMVFMPVGQIQYAIDDMDWDVVSTVAFFSLEAGRDGGIARDNGWKAWISPRMDNLIAKAHANGTKVVMSLERFSWSPGQTRLTSALLGSQAARERLAREAAAEVARRGVDGVNIDFEPIPTGRKAEFTDFVRRLRRALDDQRPGYQLTFAIIGHHTSYDVAGAVGPDAADAVYLMGYHYAGTFSKVAGSNAPMGGPRYGVDDTVKGLLKLVKPHEIIVGVPYYGHVWPTVNGKLGARTVGGGYDMPYNRAVALGRQIGLRYDKVQQVSWGRVQERRCRTCKLQWYQLYFDDHRAIAHKWAWIKAQKLLGGGVWTIGYEGGQGALTEAMRKAFLDPAAPPSP